jgi:rRNA maturation endonuclease Nob1
MVSAMGKCRKSKKYEEYYGRPYEPKTFTFVWVCPKCGWTKPEVLNCHTCGRCGVRLIRITRRVERVQAPK